VGAARPVALGAVTASACTKPEAVVAIEAIIDTAVYRGQSPLPQGY